MTAEDWPREARRTLFIDGKQVGEGRINATVPMIYSGDETCDLGVDTGTPVSEDYTSESSHFTGRVKWVELRNRRRQPRPSDLCRATHAGGHRHPVANRGSARSHPRVVQESHS